MALPHCYLSLEMRSKDFVCLRIEFTIEFTKLDPYDLKVFKLKIILFLAHRSSGALKWKSFNILNGAPDFKI